MNSIPGFDFEDFTVKATVAFLSGSMGMSLKVMSACHWHVIGTSLARHWHAIAAELVASGFNWFLNSHVQAAISLAAEKRGAEENDFWISTQSIQRGCTQTSECIRARAEQISKLTRNWCLTSISHCISEIREVVSSRTPLSWTSWSSALPRRRLEQFPVTFEFWLVAVLSLESMRSMSMCTLAMWCKIM